MKKKLPEINYRKGQIIIAAFAAALLAVIFVITRSEVISSYELYLKDDHIVLDFKANDHSRYYCIATDHYPSLEEDGWIEADNNSCIFKLDQKTDNFYLKNTSGLLIDAGNDYGLYTANYSLSNNELYLTLGEEIDSPFAINIIGSVGTKDIRYNYDDSVIEFLDNGRIRALSKGECDLILEIKKEKVKCHIYVTDLLLPRSASTNPDKEYIKNGMISSDENDILDMILKDRVENAGYATRAGAVEAARFLAIDFKYRIDYFFENGRLTVNRIDGEGRYYHQGLYLAQDRKSLISKSTKYGPAVWGETLYSTQAKKKSANGLNCSGFVSWALVNGGYDPGDIGAVRLGTKDFQDIGKSITCNKENLAQIKTGDLLHSNETGGHIAMLIGKDDNHYYIAEALWFKPTGVVVSIMTPAQVAKRFDKIVLMDSFYLRDGDLKDLWY